jgi:hypothetical protein
MAATKRHGLSTRGPRGALSRTSSCGSRRGPGCIAYRRTKGSPFARPGYHRRRKSAQPCLLSNARVPGGASLVSSRRMPRPCAPARSAVHVAQVSSHAPSRGGAADDRYRRRARGCAADRLDNRRLERVWLRVHRSRPSSWTLVTRPGVRAFVFSDSLSRSGKSLLFVSRFAATAPLRDSDSLTCCFMPDPPGVASRLCRARLHLAWPSFSPAQRRAQNSPPE